MKKLKKEAESLLLGALKKSFPDANTEGLSIIDMLEYPPDTSMGDLALPCFKLSKTLRSSPVKIAEALAECAKSDSFSEVNAVNGYLNFRINPTAFAMRVVSDMDNEGESYGSPKNG
jgi:arginyl-tRNA synthetase